MLRFPLVAAIAGLAFPAAAQTPPLVTDRPDQTESAAIVPVGALQMETGALNLRTAVAGGTFDAQAWGTTLARIGVLPRLEARLGFAGWQRNVLSTTTVSSTQDGMGDTEAGVKIALMPPGGAFELAVLAGATLPTGADAFSSGRVDPRARLALAAPLAERIGLGINAGLLRSSSGPGAAIATRSDALYSAVLGFGLTDRVSAFAESFGTLPVSTGGASEHAVDGGVTVLLTPTMQLDASGGVGLNNNAADWFVGVGISVRVGR